MVELRRDREEKRGRAGKEGDRKERQAGKKIEVEKLAVSRMTDS